MSSPSLAELERAAAVIYRVMPATPQISWPLLNERAGTKLWIKHENHTPIGAFKIRGGLVYFEELRVREPQVRGVIAATRGNHGQSIALAAQRAGLRSIIVVPRGNSPEKNRAMRAFGAELIEHGADFQESLEHASSLAGEEGLHFVPSFHEALVWGVGTGSLELLRAVPGLQALYVPIGLGSGICGALAARAALGLTLDVIGVVTQAAPAYAASFAARRSVSAPVGATIADGMACRVPDASALEQILRGVARIVTVSDDEIRAAMRHLFTDTHNVAEGAGAAALAAVLQERDRIRGRSVAAVLSGGNVDRAIYAEVLGGGDELSAPGMQAPPR